jgi:subfamily B ATP-binding cassette protein MsbA
VNAFLRLLRFARPYRGRLAIAVLGMVVYAAGQGGLGLLVEPLFDDGLGLDAGDGAAGGPVTWSIQALAFAILAAYLLKGVGGYVSGYLMTDVGQQVVRDLRSRLFRHILDQSAAFFSRRTSGQLLSRTTNDVQQLQRAVSETAGDTIRESLTLVVWVGLMFHYDWQLAVVTLTAAPLVVYPLVRLGQRVRRTSRRSHEVLEDVTHRANEAFAGHRIVKAFSAEAREAAKFDGVLGHLYRTNMKVTGAVAALPPLMEFIGGFALWYGSSRIATDELTPGEFSGFLFAAFMMYAPIKKLSRVNATVQQALAAAHRVFEMLDTHTEVRDAPGAPALARLARGVEFRGVGFAYEDRPDRPVLSDVSFDVRAGQVVAIVGLSGAGKTTLVNLIPRFFDVTAGAILIDGVDIRNASLTSLREQTALVTQDTVLFDATIAENIAYGRPDASAADVEAAARAAHAHDFIETLSGGYDARIGERGQRLSGGQRQRLAIARALLTDAPLLLLDEATSSLDAESEQLVQEALANLMRNRTTFVIAHRLSTVRRADLIVALEAGRVADLGTHDALVGRAGGVYAKLYALQAFSGPGHETVAAGRAPGAAERAL